MSKNRLRRLKPGLLSPKLRDAPLLRFDHVSGSVGDRRKKSRLPSLLAFVAPRGGRSQARRQR